MAKQLDKTGTGWQLKFTTYLQDFRNFGRKTVESAWLMGECLKHIKAELKHGEFEEWLAQHNLNSRMARRFRELHEAFENGQVVRFGSVDEAMKAIPKPQKKEEETSKSEIKTLSVAEKRLMEKSHLVEQTKQAEERAQKCELELEEIRQQNEHLLSGEKVAKGFEQGISKIEDLQAEIRQLKHKNVRLEGDKKQLKMDLAAHKRWATKEIKEKDAEIERLKEGEM